MTYLLLGLTVMSVPASWAQSAAAATPRFEVVSVKPCKPGDGGGGGRKGGSDGSPSPGSLDLTCRTVMDLVQMAYIQYADGELKPPGRHVPISGGPPWIDSARYSIDAKAEGIPGRNIMRGPMLQALLEDRFQLKIHRETREVPVYALTVAKGGPKLQIAQPGRCIPRDPDHPVPPSQRPPGVWPCGVFAPSRTHDGSYMYGTTLANFCLQLSLVLDRDVIDKTAIAGVFDVHVEIHVETYVEAPPADNPAPGDPAYGAPRPFAPLVPASPTDTLGSAIFDAVERLGLKLEPAKGPGELLVIDRVAKPSGN
jgi:uncharacterized protein (TIGR03435 family)